MLSSFSLTNISIVASHATKAQQPRSPVVCMPNTTFVRLYHPYTLLLLDLYLYSLAPEFSQAVSLSHKCLLELALCWEWYERTFLKVNNTLDPLCLRRFLRYPKILHIQQKITLSVYAVRSSTRLQADVLFVKARSSGHT